jgi:hypothetical protein
LTRATRLGAGVLTDGRTGRNPRWLGSLSMADTPRPARAALGTERPRLVVVDELAVTTPLDPYLGLRALATYSGCSVRWLRDRLEAPQTPLPCFRLPPGGRILVRRSDFDAWIARYRQVGRADVTAVVQDVLVSLASGGRPLTR